jgi:hypothetical protein
MSSGDRYTDGDYLKNNPTWDVGDAPWKADLIYRMMEKHHLQMLRDLGYEVLDHKYTAGYALPREYGLKDKLLKIPRSMFYPLFPDFTVRVFGGYSLLVLVK